VSTPFRPVVPSFPWEKDLNPRIQALDEERAALLMELGIESDPILKTLRTELVFSLECEIDALRRAGSNTQGRQAR